jgi:hypothetical protein
MLCGDGTAASQGRTDMGDLLTSTRERLQAPGVRLQAVSEQKPSTESGIEANVA